MQTVLSIDLIVSDPEVRKGRPVIAGTGVAVSDIAAALVFRQKNPDTIALEYGLSLGQVYAALAYYYEHKAAIDEDIRREDEHIQALKEQRVGSRHSLLPG